MKANLKRWIGQKVDCNPIQGSFHLVCDAVVVEIVKSTGGRFEAKGTPLLKVREGNGKEWLIAESDIVIPRKPLKLNP